MIKLLMIFPLVLSCFAADPSGQAVNTWQEHAFTNVGEAQPTAYENDFVWSDVSNRGYLFGGHRNWNTNMTWEYDFVTNTFTELVTLLRPVKRCGGKQVYDPVWHKMYSWNGGMHNYSQEYGIVNAAGTDIIGENPSWPNVIWDTRDVWAFDPQTRQWYDMRPLQTTWTTISKPWRGYNYNLCFARDYGLVLLAPPYNGKLYLYNPHANQIMARSGSVSVSSIEGMTAAYDLRMQKAVFVGGTASYDTGPETSRTLIYDIGANTWQTLSGTLPVLPGVATWGGGQSSIAFDEKNGVSVLLTSNGANTWTLDLSNGITSSWTNANAGSTHPSAAGWKGSHFTYVSNSEVCGIYSNGSNEVWTYKTGNGIPGRPDAPVNLTAVTTASEVNLTWDALSSGSVDGYTVYRALWSATTGYPSAYQKIADVNGTAYTDTPDVGSGQKYSYCVKAKSGRQESDPSCAAYSSPRVVQALVASAMSFNQVNLIWKPSLKVDIAGYNVYRAMGPVPGSKNGFVKLNAALVTQNVYEDNSVDLSGGLLAHYVVTVVNRLGQESGLSPMSSSAPDGVGGLYIDEQTRTLHWHRAFARNVAYNVYKQGAGSDFGGGYGDWGKLNSSPVSDTFYTVSDAGCYAVRAVNLATGKEGYKSDFVPYSYSGAPYGGHSSFRNEDGRNKPIPWDPFWDFLYQAPVQVSAIDPKNGSPAEYIITACPNPFNPSTNITIEFKVHPSTPLRMTSSNFKFQIYSINGRLIEEIDTHVRHNRAVINWNPSGLSAGVYIASISVGERRYHQKLTLIK
jgi:hypothetical protein